MIDSYINKQAALLAKANAVIACFLNARNKNDVKDMALIFQHELHEHECCERPDTHVKDAIDVLSIFKSLLRHERPLKTKRDILALIERIINEL